MGTAIPVIKRPDHRDARGIGGPHGERRAGHTIQDTQLRTELFPETEMAPFVKQMQVQLAEGWTKAIRVITQHLATIAVADGETVLHWHGPVTEKHHEQPVRIALHGPALFAEQHGHGHRVGLKHANDHPIHTGFTGGMRPQHIVRRGGFAANKLEGGVGYGSGHSHA